MSKNILFMHSGGVTPVVNTVVSTLNDAIHNRFFVCPYGVVGLKAGIWTAASNLDWAHVATSPAMAFGSSRSSVPEIDDTNFYQHIFKQLDQSQIGTLICNGGNNSQNITLKLHQAAMQLGYDLNCIGIPKTIDNDIMHTDTCIGFGTAAKYTALSCLEISLDLASMCQSHSKVIIYQAMGRNVGWLAAASVLAKHHPDAGPHLILTPEAKLNTEHVIKRIQECIKDHSNVVICIAEGVKHFDEISAPSPAHRLAALIKETLGLSAHIVMPDYLQRSARHIASQVDVNQAISLSNKALELAEQKRSGIMTTIHRIQDNPYVWRCDEVMLEQVAGYERHLPSSFITEDQMYINDQGVEYIRPLIQGESYPVYQDGLPLYSKAIYTHAAKLRAKS